MSLSLAGLLAACSSSDDDPPATKVIVPAGDVPDVNGSPYRSEAGHFYLVHNTDGVLAFSWTCTHQGCTVPWKEGEEQFRCPCHGSVFDTNGVNIEGPAERPLDLVALEVSGNGDITVDPRATRKRDSYEPSQAVDYPPAGGSVVGRSAMNVNGARNL